MFASHQMRLHFLCAALLLLVCKQTVKLFFAVGVLKLINSCMACVQVGFETEGTAIFDTMQFVKNEVRANFSSMSPHFAGATSHFPQHPLKPSAMRAGAHGGRGRGHRAGLHAAVGRHQGQALHAPARHRCWGLPALRPLAVTFNMCSSATPCTGRTMLVWGHAQGRFFAQVLRVDLSLCLIWFRWHAESKALGRSWELKQNQRSLKTAFKSSRKGTFRW